MTNLKNETKKLLSSVKALFLKILPHLIIIVIISGVAFYVIRGSIKNAEDEALKYEKYKQEQEYILDKHQKTIDSMQTANYILERDLIALEGKLDSITKQQKALNENYQEEIDVINNATLPEHAVWFYAKLDSIRQYYSR